MPARVASAVSRERWRGLAALVRDAVTAASTSIERVHLGTARRTFVVLEAVPPLALPARGVHAVHDATVAGVHRLVRLGARAAGAAVDLALRAYPPKAG